MKASVSLLALAASPLPRRLHHRHRPGRQPPPPPRRPRSMPKRRRRTRRPPPDRGRSRRLRRRAPSGSWPNSSVINSRAQWVNATYITHDTDALAAHFGTHRHRDGRAPRQRGGALRRTCRASAPTRSASSTSCAPASSCRRRPRAGAAAELNRISTDLQSQYGRGRGTMNGETLTGNEIEARMGTVRNPGPAPGDVDQLEQQCRRADARRICAPGRDRQPGRARARLRRHRRDVALANTT